MRRRDFVRLTGVAAAAVTDGLAVWPSSSLAQQPSRVRRIGVLMAYPESNQEGQALIAALPQALRKLGWTDGANLRIEVRWGALDDGAALSRSAKELLTLEPEVIVTQNTPATAAMRQQTTTVPIVFALVSDPVGSGFAESLARPGGNVTGFTNLVPSLAGKWVELLKEIAPHVVRVGILSNPVTAPYVTRFYEPALKGAAETLGVNATSAFVHTVSDLEVTITTIAREPDGGLIVMPDDFLNAHSDKLIALAAHNHLPAIYPWRFLAEAGGLVSYGSQRNQFPLAAVYVDRILRGEKPADLAVQAPTKYELIVNLKTAKALGLDVPALLQQRADEVIE
jgi:putative tryptophan/tyrosine transport system substrate-binding protein